MHPRRSLESSETPVLYRGRRCLKVNSLEIFWGFVLGFVSHTVGKGKGKGKVHPRTGHQGPQGEQRYSSTLSWISVLDGVVVNATPWALYPQERPGTHCTGGWVGPRAVLERCGKFRPPPPGFDPRTVQPVGSRYTDWAIPVLPVGFTPGKQTRYQLYRRLSGSHRRSVKGPENLAPQPVFEPQTVQPMASRYTDWTIPAARFERGTSQHKSRAQPLHQCFRFMPYFCKYSTKNCRKNLTSVHEESRNVRVLAFFVVFVTVQ